MGTILLAAVLFWLTYQIGYIHGQYALRRFIKEKYYDGQIQDSTRDSDR
jgi:hypothetical protein